MMYLLTEQQHAALIANCGSAIGMEMLKAMQPVKPCGYTSPDWVSLKGNGTIVKKPVQTWTCPVYTPTKD
jgi:hypothetical protein